MHAPDRCSELAKQSVIDGARVHNQQRLFVKWILDNAFLVLEDNPQMLSLLLPMVLAAFAMAREEIQWYFFHTGQPIPARVKPKNFDAFLYGNQHVAELLTSAERLYSKICPDRSVAEDYYFAFLNGSHADLFDSTLKSFLVDPSMDPRVQDILRAIPNQLKCLTAQNAPETLCSIQRNWTRAVIYFVCSDVRHYHAFVFVF